MNAVNAIQDNNMILIEARTNMIINIIPTINETMSHRTPIEKSMYDCIK